MSLKGHAICFLKTDHKDKEINVRAKIIKLSEENMGTNLCDRILGNGFTQSTSNKRKINGHHQN